MGMSFIEFYCIVDFFFEAPDFFETTLIWVGSGSGLGGSPPQFPRFLYFILDNRLSMP